VFSLSKWYLDCVADDGETVIVYSAELRFGALAISYASLLLYRDQAETRLSLRRAEPPIAEGSDLIVRHPALELAGRWTAVERAIPPIAIFSTERGEITWSCLSPRAEVELSLEGRAIRGRGYAEHTALSLAPWGLPIDELRWGRFVGARRSLSWIDWRFGAEPPKQWLFLDAARQKSSATIDPAAVILEGGPRLRIEEAALLRDGAIGGTALQGVPGLAGAVPGRILGLKERKERAAATLEDEHGAALDRGFVIQEIVRWPP
jgi:hypothetical protein